MKNNTLKRIRQNIGISAKKASEVCCVPFRTYQRYEQDESYGNDLKRKAIIDDLNKE